MTKEVNRPDIQDDLAAVVRELLDQVQWFCDIDECECDDYLDAGTCCHTRAHALLQELRDAKKSR